MLFVLVVMCTGLSMHSMWMCRADVVSLNPVFERMQGELNIFQPNIVICEHSGRCTSLELRTDGTPNMDYVYWAPVRSMDMIFTLKMDKPSAQWHMCIVESNGLDSQQSTIHDQGTCRNGMEMMTIRFLNRTQIDSRFVHLRMYGGLFQSEVNVRIIPELEYIVPRHVVSATCDTVVVTTLVRTSTFRLDGVWSGTGGTASIKSLRSLTVVNMNRYHLDEVMLTASVDPSTNEIRALYRQDVDLMEHVILQSPVSLDDSWSSWYIVSNDSKMLTVRIHDLSVIVRVWVEVLNLRVSVEACGDVFETGVEVQEYAMQMV